MEEQTPATRADEPSYLMATTSEKLLSETAIHEATSLTDLVAALAQDETKRTAVAWLYRHAYYSAQRALLRDAGAIEALEAVLKRAPDDYYCQLYALGCLSLFEDITKHQTLVRAVDPMELEQLRVAMAATDDDDARIEAVEIVACLYSLSPEADELAAFVPQLVALLCDPSARVSSAAARTLADLARDHAPLAIEHGAVPVLVELLRTGDQQQTERAAVALAVLIARDPDVGASAFACGVLAPLLEQLRDGVGEQKVSATLALCALFGSHEGDAVEVSSALPLLFDLVRDGDDDDQASAVTVLSAMVTNHQSTLTAPETVSQLVDTLREGVGDVQYLVATLITTVVDGDRASKAAFVRGGVMDPLVALLDGESQDAKIAAALLLAELVDSNDAHKQAALDAGAIVPLVAMLREDPSAAKPLTMMNDVPRKLTALRAVYNLSLENGICKLRLGQAGAIPVLVNVVQMGETMNERLLAAAALTSLMTGNEVYAIEASLLGASERLIELARQGVETSNESCVASALGALCALSASKHNQDALLGLGIRGLLSETDERSPMARLLVAQIRQHLGLQASAVVGQGTCAIL